MKNVFDKFENAQFVSADLYTMQDEKFFAMESENRYYFCQQNKSILDKIAEFSKDVTFVYNADKTSVLAVEMEEDNLKVTILPSNIVHLYKLSSCDEFVIGVTVGKNTLFVKTCQDVSEDIQKNNMYCIDIKSNSMVGCDSFSKG